MKAGAAPTATLGAVRPCWRSARALGPCLWAALAAGVFGCHGRTTPDPPAPSAAPTPDRLAPGETLPEAETAFGLALPAGMRVVRHFHDAAYFVGDISLDAALEHISGRVRADGVQRLTQGVLFPRASVASGDASRLLRIELSTSPRGTQLYVKDITPPPAVSGVSEAESWRLAGRKPDGTPLDPNQLY